MDHHWISAATHGCPSFALWFNLIFLGCSNLLAMPNHCFNLSSFTSITALKGERVQEKENRVHCFKDSFCIIFSVLSCFLYSCCLPRVIYIYFSFLAVNLLFNAKKPLCFFVSFVSFCLISWISISFKLINSTAKQRLEMRLIYSVCFCSFIIGQQRVSKRHHDLPFHKVSKRHHDLPFHK